MTKPQKHKLKGKKPDNTRVYDNYHACYYCGELRLHINGNSAGHMKVHRKIPAVREKFEKEAKPDFTDVRKLGDHKHNVKVIKEGCGEIILSRRPSQLDISLFGPCPNCKEWMLLKNMRRHYRACAKSKTPISKRQVIILSQVEAGVISSNPSRRL